MPSRPKTREELIDHLAEDPDFQHLSDTEQDQTFQQLSREFLPQPSPLLQVASAPLRPLANLFSPSRNPLIRSAVTLPHPELVYPLVAGTAAVASGAGAPMSVAAIEGGNILGRRVQSFQEQSRTGQTSVPPESLRGVAGETALLASLGLGGRLGGEAAGGIGKLLGGRLGRPGTFFRLLGESAGVGAGTVAGKAAQGAITGEPPQEVGRSAFENALLTGSIGSAIHSVAELPVVKRALIGVPKPSSLEELQRLPESEVARLPATQRTQYFRQKELESAQSFAHQANTLKDALTSDQARLKADAEVLKELTLPDAAHDAVVASRQDFIHAIQRESKAFGEARRTFLQDPQLASAGIRLSDLRGMLLSEFKDSPEFLQTAQEAIGLPSSERQLSQLPPHLVDAARQQLMQQEGIEASQVIPFKTLYQRAEQLRRGVPFERTGRTFTPQELIADKVQSTLMRLVRKQGFTGMDDALARWARYAPYRDKFVAEAKVFQSEPLETEKMARTLMEVAQGTAPKDTRLFIDGVEKLLGRKLTTDLTPIVERMSALEKQQLVGKLDTEARLLNVEHAKEANLQSIRARSFQTEVAAEPLEAVRGRARFVGRVARWSLVPTFLIRRAVYGSIFPRRGR